MSRIRLLDDHLISQIAAGEVVERPASVVKEAMENSIDAGATRIDLDLEGGGKVWISLRDDGSGMDVEDAQRAFQRHATSKIETFADLENVGTLGFRGEALASIASVSKTRLVTATAPGEGFLVEIEGGEILRKEPTASPVGTRLEVRSLFFNVPARREFLKRDATETRRCLEVVQGYALAHPEISFRVRHEGKEVLDAPRSGSDAAAYLERIAQLFGSELASKLTEIRGSSMVGGFVGAPETSKGRKSFVFVNGRLLKDRRLLSVFYRCVRNEWKTDRFPSLFLYLAVPEESVDVNVHPQKAEVRFRDEAIFGTVYNALRRALQEARGEVPAPLAEVQPLQDDGVRPRWQGLGASSTLPSHMLDDLMPSVSGASETPPRQQGLAEVSYREPARTPVPLSGNRKGRQSLRLVGQYKGSLILLEAPDALLIVDQHVAHERILYDQFLGALEGRPVESQTLVEPVLLEVGIAGSALLEDQAETLDRLGFGISVLSAGTVALSKLPARLRVEDAAEVLRDLASRLKDDGADVLGRQLVDELAASMACRSAVKIHHPLHQDEMERLISDLFDSENPWSCPHGRPIILRMEDIDFERQFKRR
ncbi:MAG: DNA mismatch repair endonuclease MutL [Acidobacteriota bacterium]